jgi:hypothetical protein
VDDGGDARRRTVIAPFPDQEHVTRSVHIDPPPLPDLNLLRDLGVPTVTDEEFASAVAAVHETRCSLYAAVVNDGWRWDRTWNDAIRIQPPAR